MVTQQVLENRAKWIKALRSGEYTQCKGVMFDGQGGHCCLGVAAMIFKGDPLIKNSLLPLGSMIGPKPYLEVYKLIGTYNGNKSSNIINMNDRLGFSFSKIADELENNPSKYFE